MTITAQDILDLLPIVANRGWRLYGSAIRDKDGFCPICALLNETHGTRWEILPGSAWQDAELPEASQAISIIANAADWPSHTMRSALMVALDIPQEEA